MASQMALTGQPVIDDTTVAVRTRPRKAAPGGVYGVRTAGAVMNRQPPIADHNTSLRGAWGRLRGTDSRHLVVVDGRLRPVGVLEERDLALAWPPGPFEAHRVPLRDVLRGQDPPSARGDDGMAAVARAMLAAGTDALPVVDDGRLIGLITARHCIELVASSTVS